MKEVKLGPGLAPDVVILDDVVYVAYGQASPSAALVIVSLTLQGTIVSERTIPTGFYNSWPRFGGEWCAYKMGAPTYGPAAINVLSGQTVEWTGQADGNFCLAINDLLGLTAYQNGGQYHIFFGDVAGNASDSGLIGKADGIDTFVSRTQVTLRADHRTDVPGMFYPVYAGDLVVGEWVGGYGIASQLTGDILRVALEGQNSPTPRCATDGATYALVIGGDAVTVLLASRNDLLALPPAVVVPPEPIPPDPIPPIPPDPVPPHPKPPIPPIPIPPVLPGDSCMQIFVTVDPSKVITAKSVIPSKATPGCFNVILEDGSVFSAHGDTRPAGTDGPWEAGQQTGAGIMTFWADGVAHPYGLVLTDKLPK